MFLYPDEEQIRMVLQQVEANAEHLARLHVQQERQHQEFMDSFKQLTEISKAHLEIAQGYQRLIGDPLQRGRYALAVIRTVVAWLTGLILTGWGLKEIFDVFFMPRPKP